MSEFILSDEIAKNKIFLLHHSDLGDRLDAQFYWEDMDFSNCIKLSKIAKVSGGKRLPKGFDYSKDITNYRYLRIGNINWDSTLDYDNFKYVSEELYTKLKHYEIHNNDLLLAIVGATIGKCSLLSIPNDDKIILTENCAKIQIIDSNILPHYLLFLLQSNFVQKQIQLNYVQTTLPKLGLDRVLSLYLPSLPSIEKQQKLLDIYQSAFLLKKQKEKQAKELLNSIDVYLLDELGITLPEVDNSLEKRIFEVNLSQIHNRFEPHYYKKYFKDLEESKNKGIYSTEKLSILCNLLNGYAFKSKDYINNSNTINIRMSNIRPNNSFNPDYNIKYLPDSYFNKYKQYLLNDGDLIIAMTDMASDPKILGVPTIVTNSNNRKLLLNQRVGKFHNYNFDLVTKEYLYNILGSKLLKDYYNQQGARGVQINISREQILNAKIPLPPIKKQNEIAKHIQNIRDKAKQLKNEAVQDLENAKNEVEQMILGQ